MPLFAQSALLRRSIACPVAALHEGQTHSYWLHDCS
jgi:hypothetical protein